MTDNRILWAEAKNRLAAAVSFLGFAPELAELMAKQLGSPKAIDRMTKYIYLARPRSEEMLVDEMLAICDEIDAWRRKKTGQEAQANYYALREYGGLGRDDTGEEE
jgi:hypothetical protein